MSSVAHVVPKSTPNLTAPAMLLAGMLILMDIVALLVVLPIPSILMLAPLLVHGDTVDLGFWLIDTATEGWIAALPGGVLVAAIVATTATGVRAQREWLKRWAGTPSELAGLDQPNTDSGIAALTDRETQVLEQMARGLTNRAIAERLLISEATVRKHIGAIFKKLEVDGAGRDRRVTAILTYIEQSRQPSRLTA